MTILNESGIPDVLSPLHAVNSIAERFPNAFIFVVGTRAEAYLAQSLSAAFYYDGRAQRDPRVVFMILDPAETLKEGKVAARAASAAAKEPGLEMALLVASRSAELLGLDAPLEASLAAQRLGIPVKAVSPNSEGPGCLNTDLEDNALAAALEVSPGAASPDKENAGAPAKRGGILGNLSFRERGRQPARQLPRIALVGASRSPRSGQELAAELQEAGIDVSGRIPAKAAVDLPIIDDDTVVALADPYLTAVSQAVEKRGAKVVRTLAPIGIDGTYRFINDVARATGRDYDGIGRAREVRDELEHLRSRVRGKRIFFAGDTGLEIPVARFLAEAGAVVVEVGAPRLDRKALAEEIKALGSAVDVIESPDWQGQIERADAARPDVVVTSPGLHVPMVARGHLCRSSLDLLRIGIHGYDGARRILELFARSFERAEILDSVNL